MIRQTISVALATMLISCCVLAGPAQELLGDLAQSARTERMVSGWTSIGLGSAIGAGGFLLFDDTALKEYSAIAGGLIALPGAITLAIPSEAERACKRACDSELEAAMALEQMAANARLERYLSGIVNLAAGIASLFFPYGYITQYDYVYSAGLSLGMGALDFLLLSKEERAYRRYERLAASEG